MALEHFTINKDRYALVLSNLRMPGLNGLELIKQIKKINPNVRTLLMTAFECNDTLFQEHIKKQLINASIQKPIRLDKLREEVNNQLDTYDLQRQESMIKI